MKILKVQNKYDLLLDDEDFEILKHEKFDVQRSRGKTICKFNKRSTHRYRFVHTFLLGFPKERIIFKDQNTFNCQKVNLLLNTKDLQKQKKFTWSSTYKKYAVDNAKKWAACNKFSRAKSMAKQRGMEFTLTENQYLELRNKPCYYSGERIDNIIGIGLDRIDNTKGYVLENVLPCAGWVNKMRGTALTVEETKIAVNAVLSHRKSKL